MLSAREPAEQDQDQDQGELPIPALPFMTYYNKRGQAMPPSPAGVTTSFNIVNKSLFAQF